MKIRCLLVARTQELLIPFTFTDHMNVKLKPVGKEKKKKKKKVQLQKLIVDIVVVVI